MDQKENGTYASIQERMMRKYGEDFAQVCKRAGAAGKSKPKPGLRYSAEKIAHYKSIISKYDQMKWGWRKKCADEIGISHTQLRRFLNMNL